MSAPAQNERGDVTIVSVTPESGPSSDATKDLVSLMRAKAGAIPERAGVDAYVTGTTALNIDTVDPLGAALPRYVAVVVGLALLLLTMVFRSILVPIKAAHRAREEVVDAGAASQAGQGAPPRRAGGRRRAIDRPRGGRADPGQGAARHRA